ncbi:MFS transporter, partial [Akkermansiaceae bacterium]|nr:MFS transporter [Akkermansiaceae bacterium]
GYIASLSICAWAFNHYKAPFEDAADAISLKNNAAAIVEDVSLLPDRYATSITPENISEETIKAVAATSLKTAKEETGAGSIIVLLSILGFIAAHAVGQGAVIWVLISEIFPAAARGFGQSLGCATHWVFAAILTFAFPLAMEAFSATQIFGFFAFMMVLHLIWVKVMVPETKSISLEDMQRQLNKKS